MKFKETPELVANTAAILAYYRNPASRMREFKSIQEIKNEMEKLGYEFCPGKFEKYGTSQYVTLPKEFEHLIYKKFISFIYPGIREKDTKISFSHATDARRDENFKALQRLRHCAFVEHNGGIFAL